ncbi:hypothetical protein [Alteribacter keqinensis]|uniref:Uncharacterized protein n=1 Tax=Alteribacter keqinensis TaxID=2483800 RepID=A0A3M7TQY5_9BACI|nr:hypothetical protein [Alteribacter keqinensis]RNA67978.1 hypothetical protein EBO34_14910 [Alteribacter keqinensis]
MDNVIDFFNGKSIKKWKHKIARKIISKQHLTAYTLVIWDGPMAAKIKDLIRQLEFRSETKCPVEGTAIKVN